MTLLEIEKTAYEAVKELLGIAKTPAGGIMIIGCSSSEVCGGLIGHASSPETADVLYRGIRKAADEAGVYVAAQCCEHLNRAVVIERKAVEAGIAAGVICPVNVVPQPKAGGSFAAAAYREASDPVVLEHVRADCGLDIGGTLIGMHLKEVAVPVRLSVGRIGEANLIAARTRPKCIGGCRAVYNEEIM